MPQLYLSVCRRTFHPMVWDVGFGKHVTKPLDGGHVNNNLQCHRYDHAYWLTILPNKVDCFIDSFCPSKDPKWGESTNYTSRQGIYRKSQGKIDAGSESSSRQQHGQLNICDMTAPVIVKPYCAAPDQRFQMQREV